MRHLHSLKVPGAFIFILAWVGLWSWCGTTFCQEDSYQAFRCRHKSPTQLATMLAKVLPKDDGRTHVLADEANRQILIRGSARTIQMARKVLDNVDRPSAVKPTAGNGGTRVKFRTEDAGDAVGEESERSFSDSSAINRDLGSLNRIDSAPPIETPPQRPESASRRPDPPTDRSATTLFLPVKQKTAELEARLVTILAGRIARVESPRPTYLLRLRNGGSIEFEFDERRQGVLVTAPIRTIPQVRKLLSVLQASRSSDERVAIISIERSDAEKLRQTIRAYQGDIETGGASSPPTSANPGGSSDGRPSRTDSGEAKPSRAAELAFVNFLFQEQPAEPQDANNQKEKNTGGATPQSEPGSLDVSVEVETLPDIDVIILRGNDRDVRKLTEIIQELERLSKETQPVVRIVELQHAQSESVAEIVNAVREDLTGRRQGRVSLTPLVKPNAILLIGWGDAIESTIELIRKLDTPVDPNSQFEVFRIRHAPVQSIQSAVDSFFAGRDALGTQIRVFADTRSNSLVAYAAPRDMAELKRLIESLDVAKSESVNRAKVFELKNALAADLAQTLTQAIAASAGSGEPVGILELLTVDGRGKEMIQSGVLANVKVTANVRNNTLIVSGPAGSLPLVEALIRQLDSPSAVAQIKVFRIVNGDAGSLVQTLRSLLPSNSTTPQLPNAKGESTMTPLRFSVDNRTNSIIATGSEGDLEIIETLLLRLDEKGVSERVNEVYRLRNAPAVDVALAVNEFLRSERIVSLAAAGGGNAFEQIEQEVVVVPEPVGNSLILSATPRYFDQIKELIVELDAQPPQVLIQVLIAEVQMNDTHEFGVELGIQDSVLFDRSLLGNLVTTTTTSQSSTPAGIVATTQEVIQAATNEPGFNFNNQPLGNSGSTKALSNADRVGSQGLSHFAVGRLNSELGFGGLVLSASSQSVSVLLRALQESRRLDVLSRPQVRTLDNQPAFIQVGQRVPRIVATNITDGGLQTNSVELENVGLILGVTPRISPDGTVVMEIDAEKSSLGLEQEGIPITVSADGSIIRSPRINTTTAQTTVSAASGETIIIGGLITKESQAVTRRVPYLSEIPLLGNAFRFDSTITRRNELLIILTPHIIRGPSDSEQINQTEMARMSWCEADVFELHGDLGLSSSPQILHEQATDVIYPDVNPRGEVSPSPLPGDTLTPDPTIPSFQSTTFEKEASIPEPFEDTNIRAASALEPAEIEESWPFR